MIYYFKHITTSNKRLRTLLDLNVFLHCIADRGRQHHQPDWQNLHGTQAMVEIQRAMAAGMFLVGKCPEPLVPGGKVSLQCTTTESCLEMTCYPGESDIL